MKMDCPFSFVCSLEITVGNHHREFLPLSSAPRGVEGCYEIELPRSSPGIFLVYNSSLCLKGKERVPGTMRVPQSVPVMCYICSLKSSTTTRSPTLTVFRWHSNMFCTWSKSGLFTQPSHLLREKVPFQSRNTASSLPVPSGKNKLCSGVNLLSLHVQAEVPTLLHLKTCLL